MRFTQLFGGDYTSLGQEINFFLLMYTLNSNNFDGICLTKITIKEFLERKHSVYYEEYDSYLYEHLKVPNLIKLVEESSNDTLFILIHGDTLDDFEH